jgi:hypothetical protein
MRQFMLVTALMFAGVASQLSSAVLDAQSRSLGAIAPATTSRPTEQQWIVSDVVAAIASFAAAPDAPSQVVPVRVVQATTGAARDRSFLVTASTGAPIQVTAVDHLWSPETFRPVAERFAQGQVLTLTPVSSSLDSDARNVLTDLTVETLLDENDRLSELLEKDMRSPAAHEAAALLIGAFALRESAGWFHDVRPSLSRLTAHLSTARAHRGVSEEGKDGMLARAILTALVGRQRDALGLVEKFRLNASTDADRRWIRALRLRITGDWRGMAPTASDSVLERLEHARALRTRLSINEFLDYRQALPEDDSTDWQRIAFFDGLTVEAGNIFTPGNISRELDESALIWSRFHEGEATQNAVLEDLNERPVNAIRQPGGVSVLDWGTWAAHQQRHLAHALMSAVYRFPGKRADVIRTYDDTFGKLMLYPVVLRWVAVEPADYRRALALARPLVEGTPEVMPQGAWTLLLDKPPYVGSPAPFPLDVSWFTPAVPVGTAFDLGLRSLRPGNPRPPTRAQSAEWARAMPYEVWAVWSNEWLAVDGKPSLASVRAALAPLFAYDATALLKVIDYMTMPDAERLEMTKAICDLAAGHCQRLGELLLIQNREALAAAAYDRWESKSRDRVDVASGVTWLVRYHQRMGNVTRAEAVVRKAGEVESVRGLQELAEWHDRAGRYTEAERTYRHIIEQYEDVTVPLGTFLVRQSLRTSNPNLQTEASELLRPLFPGGLEPMAKHNLPAVPSDGVAFTTFGPRPHALGMRFTDIIVGIDGWRVRTAAQYLAVTRFRHDDMMALTVWRDGRYQDLRVRVPERSFGTRFADHRAAPASASRP